MLSVEFKVNGQPIGFMNISNKGMVDGGVYRYDCSLTSSKETRFGTEILHKQGDGFERLVELCLKDLRRQ